jgi:hypothetical protein
MTQACQEMFTKKTPLSIMPKKTVKSYHCQQCQYSQYCGYKIVDDNSEANPDTGNIPITNDLEVIEALDDLFTAREMGRIAREMEDHSKSIIDARVMANGINVIRSDQYKLSIAEYASKRLDQSLLKVEMPDIYEKFVKETVSTRYTVNSLKAIMEKKSVEKKSKVKKEKEIKSNPPTASPASPIPQPSIVAPANPNPIASTAAPTIASDNMVNNFMANSIPNFVSPMDTSQFHQNYQLDNVTNPNPISDAAAFAVDMMNGVNSNKQTITYDIATQPAPKKKGRPKKVKPQESD